MNPIFAKFARKAVVKQLATLIAAQAARFDQPDQIIEDLIEFLRAVQRKQRATPQARKHVENEAED